MADTPDPKRKREKIPPHLMAQIFQRFKQLRKEGDYVMVCCEKISNETGVQVKTVWNIIDRLRPTDQLASTYLKSRAMKLAMRLVRTADAGQIMDLFSRPSMNVIAPKAKEMGGGGEGGFFLSVQVDSCGAVKVGAATSDPTQRALPEKPASDDDIFDAEVVHVRTPNAEDPKTLSDAERRLQLLAHARQRLQAAREERGRQSGPRPGPQSGGESQEDEGLQVADGDAR